MIIEEATLLVKPGMEAEFEAAVAKAVDVFRAAKGCQGLHLQKCIEEPTRYQAIIRWATLENHTVDFRESDLFQQWRGLVGAYFSAPPTVLHFEVTMPRADF